MAMFGFDLSLVPAADLKAGVGSGIKILEKAITSPANIDAAALATAEIMINKVIDEWKADHPLVVGAPVPSAAQVQAFLATFPATPQPCADFCKAHPLVVAKLQTPRKNGEPLFTEAEKIAVLGNIDWLDLLLKMAPILFKILLAFLV